ncbi:MAG: hypothetical protein QY318_01850 [Candidatus Dojkabacteria bacterium]|nr:MAG: hypothetical protein QY318_01850 [Candidatus Dojkabacteria bacterium]
MKDPGETIVYKVGIVLSEVVETIQEMFAVINEDGATNSARKYAMMKLEECILQLQNLKNYLKQSD